MRKIFFLLIMSTGLSLMAQDPVSTTPVSRFFFGFHAGVNTSRFGTEFTDSADVSSRVGWQAGAMVRYGNRFFVQSKLELASSTSQMIGPDTSLINIETKLNRNYIQIPLMLGYKLFQSPDGKSSLNFSGGIEGTALLKAAMDENLFYVTENDFEPFSWSAIAQLGFDLWFLRLDLGFHYGLTPMLSTDDKSLNRMLTFNLGVIF